MSTAFPEPLIIPPLSLPHKQTMILLHGRGSRASKFGPVLLNTPFSYPATASDTCTTLRTSFPHAKFIFPTAPRRRATIYKRSIINQWFDSWHIDLLIDRDRNKDGDETHHNLDITEPPPQIQAAQPQTAGQAQAQDWLMIDGLQQTTTYLHALLRREITLVPGGASSVALGGISQGCAASLVAMMLWEGEALAGVLGMCGWLPYARGLMNVPRVGGNSDRDAFDPFEREDESNGDVVHVDPGVAAVEELRQRLELDGESAGGQHRSTILSTPVFLGHGVEDDCVPLQLGKLSADCLEAMGVDISRHSYTRLGHWYSSDMLRDMTNFLKTKTSFKNDMS